MAEVENQYQAKRIIDNCMHTIDTHLQI